MAHCTVEAQAPSRRHFGWSGRVAEWRERCRDVFGELGDRAAECSSDAGECFDAWVCAAAFNLAEVGGVHVTQVCELSLTELRGVSQLTNFGADRSGGSAGDKCVHTPIVKAFASVRDTPKADCGVKSFRSLTAVDNSRSGAVSREKFSPVGHSYRWNAGGKLQRCNYTMLWSNLMWFTICSASIGALRFERRA